MSETHFNCYTVDSELWLAILNSLLCPETDRNIRRIRRQGYVYLTDFKKWCFDVSYLTSISVLTSLLTLRSRYQDQSFCARFSLARLPTETARKFFLDHFLKEMTLSFFFWLLEPVQCHGKTIFVPYLLPSHVKYYPNSQNFPPFALYVRHINTLQDRGSLLFPLTEKKEQGTSDSQGKI